MIVPELKAQRFPLPDEQFPVEYKMPEEVVNKLGGLARFYGVFVKKVVVFCVIRVIVQQVPAIEVVVDDGKPEGNVLQSFGNSGLKS